MPPTSRSCAWALSLLRAVAGVVYKVLAMPFRSCMATGQSPLAAHSQEVSKTRAPSDQVTEQGSFLPEPLPGNQTPSVNSYEVFETRAPSDQVTMQSPSLKTPLPGSLMTEGVTEMEEEEILSVQKGKIVEESAEIADSDAMFGIIKVSEPFDIEDVPGIFIYEIDNPYEEVLEDVAHSESLIENYLKCNGQVAETDLPPGVSKNAGVLQVMCDTVTVKLAEQGCDVSKEAVENEWRHPGNFEGIDYLMHETQQRNYKDSGAAIIDDAMCVNILHSRSSMKKTSSSDEISCDWLVNTCEYTLEIANILTALGEGRPDLQLFWISDCGCFVKHINRYSEQPERSEFPFYQENDDELIAEDWMNADRYSNEDWVPAGQYLNEESVIKVEEEGEAIDELVFVQPEDSSVNDVRSNLLLKQPSDNEIITEEFIECSDSSIQDTQLETETSAEESFEIDSDSSIQNYTATTTNSKSSPRGRTVNRNISEQRKLNPAWDRNSKEEKIDIVSR